MKAEDGTGYEFNESEWWEKVKADVTFTWKVKRYFIILWASIKGNPIWISESWWYNMKGPIGNGQQDCASTK